MTDTKHAPRRWGAKNAREEAEITRAFENDKARERIRNAAPELLEALQRALASRWLSIDHAHNRTPEACDVRALMCAAIAKATSA